MKIKTVSEFKDIFNDFNYFESWVKHLELNNNRSFERILVNTSIGKTQVWGLNTKEKFQDSLVIFPGARTSSLFWDLDRNLDHLNHELRIFLVETNGLPNLSDGATPDIKSLDYGYWANEVLDELGIKETFIAGASFGGLICMKLGIVHADKVKAAFILNPGCLQPFSLNPKNLYYNLLPIIKPNENNVLKFLDKAVFSKPNHTLSAASQQLITDYELFALKRYKDKTQKPYFMREELSQVKVDTYLLEGDKDLLFPYQKSIANARKYLKTVKDIKVFKDVGHGIETYSKAMNYIGEKIKDIRRQAITAN